MSASTDCTWPAELVGVVDISIREKYFPNELLRSLSLPVDVFEKMYADVESICVEKMGFLVTHFSFTATAPEADEKMEFIKTMLANIRNDVVKDVVVGLFQYVLANQDVTWKKFYEKVQ
jgi:hypothetical protein